MPNFWSGMSKGFEAGVPIGIQGARDEESSRRWDEALSLRKKEQKETQDIREKREERETERHETSMADREDKKNFEKAERLVKAGQQTQDARVKARLYQQAYKYWPNGDEVMIMSPRDNPELRQTPDFQDPAIANAELVVISKNNGIMPVGSAQELDKMVAGMFNQDEYLRELAASKKNVDAANAQAMGKPMQADDGKWYITKYKMTPDGSVAFDRYEQYTGPIPMSEQKKALNALGIDPDTPEGKEIAKIVTGIKGPEGGEPSEFAKKVTKSQEGRAERALDLQEEGQEFNKAKAISTERRAIDELEMRKEEHEAKMKALPDKYKYEGKKRSLELQKLEEEVKAKKRTSKGKVLTPKDRVKIWGDLDNLYNNEFTDMAGETVSDAPKRDTWKKAEFKRITGEDWDQAIRPSWVPKGARKGPDGNWYIKDEKTGRTLKVVPMANKPKQSARQTTRTPHGGQIVRGAIPKQGKGKGKPWHQIPKNQRAGDIRETVLNLEPRKSDPFPKPVVNKMKELAAKGMSYQDIDREIVKLIKTGKLPSWNMHLSD